MILHRCRVAVPVTAILLLGWWWVWHGIDAAAQPAPEDAVLVGAGDIASCNSDGDEATARLLDTIPGTVFTAGDNAYERGTDDEFRECYRPTWGRHRARTRPAPGNHDYGTPGAAGYFRYFGAAAGEPGRGYYSYTLGTWQVLVLNSNCRAIGGCGDGSRQMAWLRAELANHRAQCTVAIWHHPPFSSGLHGSQPETQPLWAALYQSGGDVVIAGHDHSYERFAPQDAQGRPDPTGMRLFVVGTGGRSHYRFRTPLPTSEVRHTGTFGILKLVLRPGRYEWEFVPEAGKTFHDSGSAVCR
ncbi:MAG: metallophosphoesterase [Armatimonadetes bacterium]|nr:metallophosphoesterase [Armatimonadota bacterium]